MICAYKVAKEIKRLFEEREKTRREKNLDFFFDSISDETYLDMIREKIEFLIDEGYKFSEQLEIINNNSGRNIKYSTYTRFVKLFILDNPKNIFKHREFTKYYWNHNFSEPHQDRKSSDDEIENSSKKRVIRDKKVEFVTSSSESSYKRKKVTPLKKPDIKFKREKVSFKYEAMPNIEELY